LEEQDLLKYDADLIDGVQTAATDEARRRVEAAELAKQAKARLAEIPSHLRLRMPVLLKKIIIDDNEQILQHGKILALPRSKYGRPTVAEIIEEWKVSKFAAVEEGEDAETIISQAHDIAQGLLSYFNNALRQLLLYQPEVAACTEVRRACIVLLINCSAPKDRGVEDLHSFCSPCNTLFFFCFLFFFCLQALKDGALPSEVYGAEHLLRLLLKLPELIPVVMMALEGDARNILAVEESVEELMLMMTDLKAQGRFFASSEEYISNPHWIPPLAVQLSLVLQQDKKESLDTAAQQAQCTRVR